MLTNPFRSFIAGLFLLAAFCRPGFSQCDKPYCSAVIPTTTATASLSSNKLGNTSFRIEARLHGQNWHSGSNLNIFTVGGYGATYLGGNGIFNALFFTGSDTSSNGYGNCLVALGSAPPADLIVRISRDLAKSQLRGEVFNTVTGEQLGSTCIFAVSATASGSAIQSTGVTLGDPNAGALGGSIAYLRWFNTVVPAGSQPSIGISSAAVLGDWEFDGNPKDSSGNGRYISGINNYVNTPIYTPVCSSGKAQSVRVGSTITLDGSGSYALDGNAALTYAWTYLPGSDGVDQKPVLTAANTSMASAAGLNRFGSANFQLTVTDGSGTSNTCTVHHGVVMADDNGIIDLTGEGLDIKSQKFIGPLVMYGANGWPWADTIHKTEMDLQIKNMASYYTSFWRTPESGTISVTAGSTTITGNGTDLTKPCGGGNTPLAGASIFLIYPGTDGLKHYLNGQVSSCKDASHLEFQMPKGGPYPAGTPYAPWPNCTGTCSGWQWSWGYYGDSRFTPQNQYGTWSYNGAPANYYDNAKAFYALYLRSGMDSYLTAFQKMADDWWDFPVMDQGYACNPAASSCWAPAAWRSMSMNGIVLRALNEGSGTRKWAGLWNVSQLAQSYMSYVAALHAPVTIDARETGYAMSMLAYCALADPDPAHQASCKSTLKSTINTVWKPFRRTDLGNVWGGLQYSNQVPPSQATSITALGGQGSVCLTNGSKTVTGTGTVWTSTLNGFEIWFFGGDPSQAPLTNAAGDSVGYGVTINSANSLTLTSAYAGPTACTSVSGSNRGYLFGYQQGNSTPNATNGYTGWGVLPYSEGMLGTAFGWAAMAMDGYDDSSAAVFRKYLDDIVHWLMIYGMNPSQGGIYSGAMFVGCTPPIAPGNVACNGGTQSQQRTLSLDVMRAFAMDYQNTGDTAVKTAADTLMSQMFSKPGTTGPNQDGYYLSDYDGFFITGEPPIGSAPKWAGQLCGFEEACDMWPAVRMGAGSAANTTKTAGMVEISGKGILH